MKATLFTGTRTAYRRRAHTPYRKTIDEALKQIAAPT